MTDPRWPRATLLELFGIDIPIVQAPMAGAQDAALAIAVSSAGGLGSLPCAMLSPAAAREQAASLRAATNRGFAMNFFCHRAPEPDAAIEARWRERLAAYYAELGAGIPDAPFPMRRPFDEAACGLVEEVGPKVVSFHYGLPREALLSRVKRTGARILSSATTVAEARWLEEHGADAVIAQGSEAGGHRGMFLTDDVAGQVGTFALVPQVVDAVRVPVIAAGGIGDARGIAAAFALGASAVQIGTAYLRTPEARITEFHRRTLASAHEDESALTNVFTGRPARAVMNRLVREIGPISRDAPPFPLAAGAVMPLRARAEAAGSADFSPMLTGQAARLGREMPAGALTRALAEESLAILAALSR
jgi:nitronate monooxygenase